MALSERAGRLAAVECAPLQQALQMLRHLLSLFVLVLLATPFSLPECLADEPIEVVVIARVVAPPPTTPHCGVIHFVVAVEYELVEVVSTTDSFEHARFVGIVTCPEMTPMDGDIRLSLTSKNPYWPKPINEVSEGLPSFYVTDASSVPAP